MTTSEVALATLRLFDQDPYLCSFSAKVVRRLAVAGRLAVVLARTCFYPTSGGQPDFAQGGSAHPTDAPRAIEEALAEVRRLIEKESTS